MLRGILPTGVILLAAWIVQVGIALFTGTAEFALGWGSTVLGLLSSVVLIATGYHYRRAIAQESIDSAVDRTQHPPV